MNTILSISGLEKRYHTFTLGPIDLTLEPGIVLGLVGRNGAGKTTTLKCTLGLVRTDRGTIELFEKPTLAKGLSSELKERIGVVFDHCAFVDDARIADIDRLGKAAYEHWDAVFYKKLLDEFALDVTKKVSELSRGMSLSLSLAFALAHHPDLLILDEATAGLDPLARETVLEHLRNFMLEGDHGILLSTHITSDLEKIADEIVCIDNGRIQFALPKEEITDEYAIARCTHSEFAQIRKTATERIQGFHDHERGVDVLIADRRAFTRSFPNIVVDRPTIEEFMALTLVTDKSQEVTA